MELLVATVVFGLVLMVITTAILQFTRVYYKGVTESNVQETTRSIIDQISQGIQFNGGNVTTTPGTQNPGTSYAFCVGNIQYSFRPGYQLSDNPVAAKNQTYHSLVARDVGCNSGVPAQNLNNQTVVGRELMAPNMRLSRLQVTNVAPNVYKISIRVVYGDNDLLTGPTTATAKCQNVRSGTEFCAVSDITTTVVKRVE